MTREDIIQKAFRVWGRELYQRTSLTQLAENLGVTKPALYRHFPNKKALLESMYEWFFDDYAASIKTNYDRSIAADDPQESIMIMGRAIVRYYCLNIDIFLFCLIRIYGNRDHGNMAAELAKRGIDMAKLRYPNCRNFPGAEQETFYPSLVQLIIVTLMFWVAAGYKSHFETDMWIAKRPYGFSLTNPLSEEETDKLSAWVEKIILNGLALNKGLVDTVNYETLEKRVASLVPENFEDDGLYRAVAEAVAEAGPWDVSMEMVARRSGLSKSGLYSHFKNRQDMLKRFFQIEFKRIIASADAGKAQSTAPEEQLYLVVIAVANYLRDRPEILLAFDRIRTRKLDLGFPEAPQFCRVFSGINAEVFGAGCFGTETDGVRNREHISQWILFLIINMLMRFSGEELPPDLGTRKRGTEQPESQDYRSRFRGVKDSGFRILYRFIVLGICGFTENFVSTKVSSERGVDP